MNDLEERWRAGVLMALLLLMENTRWSKEREELARDAIKSLMKLGEDIVK